MYMLIDVNDDGSVPGSDSGRAKAIQKLKATLKSGSNAGKSKAEKEDDDLSLPGHFVDQLIGDGDGDLDWKDVEKAGKKLLSWINPFD
jgi:hypothetical protein